MTLTIEQENIINSNSNRIIIEALAGTGKTSTLIKFAEKYFHYESLYIVFNKDMRKTSKGKFPGNTTVHTINSFSYFYNSEFLKGKNFIQSFNSSLIMKMIPELARTYKFNYNLAISEANHVLKAYNNLMNSDLDLSSFNGDKYHNMAKDFYFNLIKSPVIDHLGLLKYFNDNFDFTSLSFDLVMIDEAQDLNPIMISILEKINPKKIVMVGDSNQAIYSFRASVNIFEIDQFKDYSKFKLTKSFRFGQAISDKVNEVYQNLFGRDLELKFNENITSEIVTKTIIGPYTAYITRTNAVLFDKALDYALMDLKVAIPFNWEELKQLIEDMYFFKLGLNDEVKSKLILQYGDFNNLKTLNKEGNDIELSYLIKIIEKHDILILDYLTILERQLSSPKYADITFLTAHKSKGLEFLGVELGSDFSLKSIEERNIIYVSMTRAIKNLNIKNLNFNKNIR